MTDFMMQSCVKNLQTIDHKDVVFVLMRKSSQDVPLQFNSSAFWQAPELENLLTKKNTQESVYMFSSQHMLQQTVLSVYLGCNKQKEWRW